MRVASSFCTRYHSFLRAHVYCVEMVKTPITYKNPAQKQVDRVARVAGKQLQVYKLQWRVQKQWLLVSERVRGVANLRIHNSVDTPPLKLPQARQKLRN